MSSSAPRTAAALALLLCACGAKTGLDVQPESMDASLPDAGRDAGPIPDGGFDSGPDALVCVPGRVRLERSEVEVVFVVDRSGSMAATFEGLPPVGSELSRWETLHSALTGALDIFNADASIGAKFFPTRTARPNPDNCLVNPGLDVNVGPGRADAVLGQFARFRPSGGTPFGPAMREAAEALASRADPSRAQFIVAATDGAPTCSMDSIDEALSAVEAAHDAGIDVFVVGIASTPPEVDLLNEMASLGGRARPASEERRFYDARDETLLATLLEAITADLAQCVFAVPIPPDEDDVIDVQLDGGSLAQDPSRVDGWDWTSDRRGQLSLFGTACDRARDGAAVQAIITCN